MKNKYSEFINKEVNVDFRKETGIVKEYNNKDVTIFYPSLGFSEIINYKLVEVKFLPNQF